MFSWLAHVFYMYHLWKLQVFVNQGSYCLCDDINNLFLSVTDRCKVRLNFFFYPRFCHPQILPFILLVFPAALIKVYGDNIKIQTHFRGLFCKKKHHPAPLETFEEQGFKELMALYSTQVLASIAT